MTGYSGSLGVIEPRYSDQICHGENVVNKADSISSGRVERATSEFSQEGLQEKTVSGTRASKDLQNRSVDVLRIIEDISIVNV